MILDIPPGMWLDTRRYARRIVLRTEPAPGTPHARAVQCAIWYRRAQWLMDQCQARFGDMFTLKIANEGTG